MRLSLVRWSLTFLLANTVPSLAWATSIYMEAGAGYSKIMRASPIWGTGIPGALDLGGAYQFSLGVDLVSGDKPLPPSVVRFHLGVQHRTITGHSEPDHFGLQAVYPFARVEAYRLFATCGATPMVRQKYAQDKSLLSGYNEFETLAILGEVGYVWTLTPEAAFLFSVAGQLFETGGQYGPKPSFESMVTLRIRLWGGASNFTSSGKDYDWDGYNGWRYPFGNEK